METVQPERLEDLRNEVLRRVGRNLLLFQQIELLLKAVVANASIESGPSGPTAEHLARRAAIGKKGLGQIRKQFRDEMHGEQADQESAPDLKQVRVRSTFRITVSDAEQLQRDEEAFEALTLERNDLVHHFLERYQLQSAESLREAVTHLDTQRERALPIHRNLAHLHKTVVEGLRATAEFLASADGQASIELMHLQSSKIVSLLALATRKVGRPDGWTLVSSAGHFIAAEDPEQLPAIRLRYGHRGLQALVAAAEVFELREEAMAAGKTRAVYRIRPEALSPS